MSSDYGYGQLGDETLKIMREALARNGVRNGIGFDQQSRKFVLLESSQLPADVIQNILYKQMERTSPQSKILDVETLPLDPRSGEWWIKRVSHQIDSSMNIL